MIFCNGPLVGKKYFYKFFFKKRGKTDQITSKTLMHIQENMSVTVLRTKGPSRTRVAHSQFSFYILLFLKSNSKFFLNITLATQKKKSFCVSMLDKKNFSLKNIKSSTKLFFAHFYFLFYINK